MGAIKALVFLLLSHCTAASVLIGRKDLSGTQQSVAAIKPGSEPSPAGFPRQLANGTTGGSQLWGNLSIETDAEQFWPDTGKVVEVNPPTAGHQMNAVTLNELAVYSCIDEHNLSA